MENGPETEYHFAFLYNRFQQIIVQFVEVTGQQVKDEEHGFNFLWTSGVQMTDYMISERITNIYILKCSSMVSAAAFAVWLCGSDVRSFVTMILFSAAIEDALSNKRRKYIFTNITHCINQNPKLNMSFYQITGNCVECNRQRSYIPEYKLSNYSNY